MKNGSEPQHDPDDQGKQCQQGAHDGVCLFADEEECEHQNSQNHRGNPMLPSRMQGRDEYLCNAFEEDDDGEGIIAAKVECQLQCHDEQESDAQFQGVAAPGCSAVQMGSAHAGCKECNIPYAMEMQGWHP